MKASDLMIRCLENESVEFVFGIPGEENLDFLESLRESSIQLIITRHEQAAGFMAAAYARVTGKVGVCLATLGPGATNFFTPAAYATLGGMPVLFITGQKPIKSSKQGRFQIIDIVPMMTPVTKFTRQIVNGNNIPSLVRECFRLATQEKPGAVHLELPEDIAAEDVDRQPFEVTPQTKDGGAARAELQMAKELIEESKRPLLLVASGANRCRTVRAALDKFIDKTGFYFCNTQMGKGVIDERHEQFLGTAALSDHDYVHCAIDRADLIINVGHDVVEKPPFFMEQGGKKVIHMSFFSAHMDDVYFPQVELVGDLSESLGQLADVIDPKKHWDFDYYKRVRTEINSHIDEKSDDDSFPLLPQRVVADLRAALKSDAVLSLDNGMYKIWFARNFKSHEPNTMLLDNALASMGAGLPGAMGVKLVNPKKQVVAICGDGGFMMNSQEIETAVRLKMDLTVVILRDDAYGMIKWKQAGMQFDNYGLDFGNPDFVKYAESYGAIGHRVSESGQLVDLLQKTFKDGGVHLIDVPIDYSENERVLIEELKNKTCLI